MQFASPTQRDPKRHRRDRSWTRSGPRTGRRPPTAPRLEVRTWNDPRCGGRLVVRDPLVAELVDLLLAGDDLETLRAFGGGCEVGPRSAAGLDVCLVGTTTEDRLIYIAVDRPVEGSPTSCREELRLRCRAMGGTLHLWTRARIDLARRMRGEGRVQPADQR